MANTFPRKSKLNGFREALHVANQRTREGHGLSAALVPNTPPELSRHLEGQAQEPRPCPLRSPLSATRSGFERLRNMAAGS